MKIIECHIENFGKLSDFKYSFSSGMNSIKKDNGYGKTTLAVFIKSMLYGLDDTKKQRLEENDRKHYMPWHGGKAGGSLTFEHNGEKYRIERTFMPKASDDTFKLYNMKSGKECTDFTSKLGEELFGIDADGFERTVFLSEQNLSGKNENKTISAKLSDLVGSDGDIGVMDDAIELLEKQRRFYYKRGGSGEIGDIKRKIGNVDLQINDLYRTKDSLKESEIRLENTTRVLGELNAERRRAESEEKEAVMRTYKKHYLQIKSQLDEELARKAALDIFFKNGVPEKQELERIKEEDAELKKLGMYETVSAKSSEYASLSAFFACGATNEEFDRFKYICEQSETDKRECEILKRNLSSLPPEYKEEVGAEAKHEKIDKAIRAISLKGQPKRKKNTILAFVIMGIMFSALGAALGILVHSAMFALCAAGIISFIIAIATIGSYSKSKKQRALIDDVKALLSNKDIPDKELLSRLYEEKARLEKIKDSAKTAAEYQSKIDTLNEEILAFSKEACEFIAKFPVKNMASITEAANEILSKRAFYSSLNESEMAAKRTAGERDARKQFLTDSVGRFILRYPTTDKYPLEEIERKMFEYESVSRTADRIRANLEEFAATHSITPETAEEANKPSPVSNISREQLSEKISHYERERTLIEREYKNSEADLERLEALLSEKEDLVEQEKTAEAKLDIIIKTQNYLAKAKDLLTAKYLSKTKKAFDSYIEIINREDGENFKMDTSFAVSKNERGELKPAEAYSQGIKDIYYLAARLAIIDSIYENETPFIVLDDPFAHLDDRRLKSAISVLSEIAKKKQIIYLTCTSSREI